MNITSYSKTELAQIYIPNRSPEAARHTLMNWIHRNRPLKQALKKAGYRDENRIFTPEQVRLICQYLGDP